MRTEVHEHYRQPAAVAIAYQGQGSIQSGPVFLQVLSSGLEFLQEHDHIIWTTIPSFIEHEEVVEFVKHVVRSRAEEGKVFRGCVAYRTHFPSQIMFCSVQPSQAPDAEVGRVCAQRLTDVGFRVSWNGSEMKTLNLELHPDGLENSLCKCNVVEQDAINQTEGSVER